MLGLLREASRLGPPASTRLRGHLDVLLHSARLFLEAEMDAGRLRRFDAPLLLLSAYSTVIGVATESELMRALGVEPDLRSLVRARRELLRFLAAALDPR